MKGLEMKLSTLSLDHLGLVAAIFDALGISDVIDESIPKTRNCKLSHSAIVKRRRRTPLQADGASEASPHKDSTTRI